jgi:hypothetical protein
MEIAVKSLNWIKRKSDIPGPDLNHKDRKPLPRWGNQYLLIIVGQKWLTTGAIDKLNGRNPQGCFQISQRHP